MLDRMTARHGLPHPLAILYDRLNQHDPREQLEEVLRFAEGVARFLAWVLVAEATARGLQGSQLRQQVGVSTFGAFLNVIDHHLRGRRTRSDAFLRDLDGFLDDPAWPALQSFCGLRNAAAHHRLPTTSAAASALLDEHRGGLQQLLDGVAFLTRYPLGVLRGAQVTTGGGVSARWFACRGLSVRSGNVEVFDISPLPTGQVLLIDPESRLALPLGPFFRCDEQAFAWLDVPHPQGPRRASVYARPVPGEALTPGVPEGVFDATGAATAGLAVEAWVADPRQRPRLLALRLDDASRRALVQSAAPTMAMDSHGGAVPAAAVLGGGATESASRRAEALPKTRVSEMPYAPTVAMAMAMAMPTVTTSVTTVPPAVAPGRAKVAGRSWQAPTWVIGLGLGLLVGAGAAGWTMRSKDSPRATRTAPLVADERPLSANPGLQRWISGWTPALGADRMLAASLGERYAAAVSFHGMGRVQTPTFIVDRWQERLRAGTFVVDPSRSTWFDDALSSMGTPAACSAMAGADPGVTVVRLSAVERGAPDGARAARSGRCRTRAGTYLLRIRSQGGVRRICHETWREDVTCTP